MKNVEVEYFKVILNEAEDDNQPPEDPPEDDMSEDDFDMNMDMGEDTMDDSDGSGRGGSGGSGSMNEPFKPALLTIDRKRKLILLNQYEELLSLVNAYLILNDPYHLI